MLGISQKDVEMQIYSLFARVARDCVDRRGFSKTQLDPATGLPIDPTAVTSKARALGGESLALQYVLTPRRFAAGILRRQSDDALEDVGTVALNSIPDAEWTDQETQWVNWLELQIKLALHRLADQHGHFQIRDVIVGMQDGEFLPMGDDGLTEAAKITYKGLQHALKITQGTKWAHGATSLDHDMGKEVMKNAPEWYKQSQP